MGIKKVIQIENTNVHVVDKMAFDKNDLSYYTKLFEDYKSQGLLSVDCSFDNSTWRFDDGIDEYPVDFLFDELVFTREIKARNFEISYEELVLSIKAFVLMLCGEVSLSNIKKIMSIFKNVIDGTNFLNPNKVEYLYEVTQNANNLFRYDFIVKYIEFNDCFKDAIIYKEAFDEIRRSKPAVVNKRKLGSYETMFKFNDILNVFTEEASKQEKIRYFPVILWWKITTIIPMRSTEFTILPKECCEYRNGGYYLSVYRTTQKAMKDDILLKSYLVDDKYELQELEVTEEIYNLITEYKNLVDPLDDIPNFYKEYQSKLTYPNEERKFLLSTRSTWGELNKTGKHFRTVRPHHEYYDSDMVARLIGSFFDKVVIDKYDFEVIEKTDLTSQISGNTIERIQMMDTRHFAFANMALQGVSPLVMKNMGGHKDIESSYHYYSQLPNFIKSYTYSLAKKLSFDKYRNDMSGGEDRKDYSHILQLNYSEMDKRSLHLKSMFGETRRVSQRVVNGFNCYSLNFPMDCIMVDNNCSICSQGSPTRGGLKEISKELDGLNTEIIQTIETLYQVVKEFKLSIGIEENIKTLSNRIQVLVNNKANLISDHLI